MRIKLQVLFNHVIETVSYTGLEKISFFNSQNPYLTDNCLFKISRDKPNKYFLYLNLHKNIRKQNFSDALDTYDSIQI